MDAETSNTTELEPLFLISDDDIARFAQRRARQNNQLARERGQIARLKASDLHDLYYKMLGRCGQCSEALTVDSIQLDHIAEARYRASLAATVAGEQFDSGEIADINNVQWVCKTCNAFKELCRRNSVDLAAYVSRIAAQSAMQFPIRSRADVCGSIATKRGRRIQRMQNEFEKSGHAISSYDVVAWFAGTELEAGHQTILRELKSIGWCGMRHMAEVRRAVVQEMAEEAIASNAEMTSYKDWCQKFNELITKRHGWPSISAVRFRQLCEEAEVTFFTSRSQARSRERDASSAEKFLIRAWLKEKGRPGVEIEELATEMRSDTFTGGLFEKSVNELAELGQIERHGSRLYYCMNRKEASAVIGVSVHRLKKWSVFGTGPVFLKNPRNTKGECYYSVRTLFDFVESRKRTRFDLVGAPGTG